MMDWTDRHCRYFHRQVSARALLFTEMVPATALLRGDLRRLLGFSPQEHPVALQLGGSDPADLARAARLGEQWGYDEINLNCGCPSDRVREGSFGACLMNDPGLVAQGVRSMIDAVSVPVTVKHRIGLGRDQDYGFVRDFVGTVAQAGCTVFHVHARNAWLDGLNPKENRTIPPLRYDVVHQLKADFPTLAFHLNGGLRDHDEMLATAQGLDGVMVGRAAYEEPWMLAQVDQRYDAWSHRRSTGGSAGDWRGAAVTGSPGTAAQREHVVAAMVAYSMREVAAGVPLRCITRHMLGLFNGLPGARRWRRMLSDATRLRDNDPQLLWRAYQALLSAADPADAGEQRAAA
ncbi:MAG: tRNA dihydrouridine(20/20a) synthase DusA [Burkholderiaceae bacterium]